MDAYFLVLMATPPLSSMQVPNLCLSFCLTALPPSPSLATSTVRTQARPQDPKRQQATPGTISRNPKWLLFLSLHSLPTLLCPSAPLPPQGSSGSRRILKGFEQRGHLYSPWPIALYCQPSSFEAALNRSRLGLTCISFLPPKMHLRHVKASRLSIHPKLLWRQCSISNWIFSTHTSSHSSLLKAYISANSLLVVTLSVPKHLPSLCSRLSSPSI
jgi:hypothetical protein